jgi:hypothetical protein
MLFRFTFLVLVLSHWVSAQSNSTPGKPISNAVASHHDEVVSSFQRTLNYEQIAGACNNVPTFALSMRVPISDFCRVFLGINPVTTMQTTTPRITRQVPSSQNYCDHGGFKINHYSIALYQGRRQSEN